MTRQRLVNHAADCFVCGASTTARNAVAWAHNHVRHNPGHKVELSMGWIVGADTLEQPVPSQSAKESRHG